MSQQATSTAKQAKQSLSYYMICRGHNTTIIVVTHDLDIAGRTDHTYQLKDGKLINYKMEFFHCFSETSLN